MAVFWLSFRTLAFVVYIVFVIILRSKALLLARVLKSANLQGSCIEVPISSCSTIMDLVESVYWQFRIENYGLGYVISSVPYASAWGLSPWLGLYTALLKGPSSNITSTCGGAQAFYSGLGYPQESKQQCADDPVFVWRDSSQHTGQLPK